MERILCISAQLDVCGGLRWSPRDEGDKKDLEKSHQSPIRRRKADINVSNAKKWTVSLCWHTELTIRQTIFALVFQKILTVNCNCMFSGSPINKIRRKHWIKQKLWRSSTWRGSSTSMRVRVILWAAVLLSGNSFHRWGWIFKSGSLTCGFVPTPDRILCPSGLHRNCHQNDEGWPEVAL